jgi:hypothetical protein
VVGTVVDAVVKAEESGIKTKWLASSTCQHLPKWPCGVM